MEEKNQKLNCKVVRKMEPNGQTLNFLVNAVEREINRLYYVSMVRNLTKDDFKQLHELTRQLLAVLNQILAGDKHG